MSGVLRARAVNAVAVAAVCLGLFSASAEPLLHAEPSHDIACSAPSVAHDPAAHILEPADEPRHAPPHCVACHFARSFRVAGSQAAPLVADRVDSILLSARPAETVASAELTQLPARSPPPAV